MEEQFFTWDDYEELDNEHNNTRYDNCVLTSKLGKFKKGTKFSMIFLLLDEAEMSLYQEDDDGNDKQVGHFSLKLKVTEIPLDEE